MQWPVPESPHSPVRHSLWEIYLRLTPRKKRNTVIGDNSDLAISSRRASNRLKTQLSQLIPNLSSKQNLYQSL